MEKVTVYALDISNRNIDKTKFGLIEEKRRLNIQSGKNYLYKLRSFYAGLLLRHAMIEEGMDVDDALEVEYNAFGKPYLKEGKNFSITHSGNIVLIAVSEAVVGIDAEIYQNKVYTHIAQKILSDKEFEKYKSLSGLEKSQYFISCWVKKEAYLKYKGVGINKYPSDVETSEDSVNGVSCATVSVKIKNYSYVYSVVTKAPAEISFVQVKNLKTV